MNINHIFLSVEGIAEQAHLTGCFIINPSFYNLGFTYVSYCILKYFSPRENMTIDLKCTHIYCLYLLFVEENFKVHVEI